MSISGDWTCAHNCMWKLHVQDLYGRHCQPPSMSTPIIPLVVHCIFCIMHPLCFELHDSVAVHLGSPTLLVPWGIHPQGIGVSIFVALWVSCVCYNVSWLYQIYNSKFLYLIISVILVLPLPLIDFFVAI